MSEPNPTVALLLAHRLRWIGFGGYWMCECSVRFPANDRDEAERAHAEHVAAELGKPTLHDLDDEECAGCGNFAREFLADLGFDIDDPEVAASMERARHWGDARYGRS